MRNSADDASSASAPLNDHQSGVGSNISHHPLLAATPFGLALGCTLFFALRPHPVPLPLNEDLQHMGAFGTLMLTGGWALRLRGERCWSLALGLLVFGGAIEGLQALPFIHRDADFKDWLADAAGIGLGWALHATSAVMMRNRRRAMAATALSEA